MLFADLKKKKNFFHVLSACPNRTLAPGEREKFRQASSFLISRFESL